MRILIPMKLHRLFPIALLFVAFACFSACEKNFEWPDAEQIAAPEMLKGAPWNLDAVVSWEMEDGVRSDKRFDLFGENTDNGICTFSFEEDICTMVDVEDENEEEVFYFADNTMVIGDEIYEITVMTENELELLVGEQEEDAEEGEVMRFSRN